MPTSGGRSQRRPLVTSLAAACLLSLTAATACAAGLSSVTAVNLERQADVLLVNVEVRGPVAYATQMLEEPKRFVVDLQRTTLASGQPARFPVDYGPVREVSIAPRRDETGTLRVMVLLAGQARCAARAGPEGGLVIAVEPEAGLPAVADRGDGLSPRLAAPGGGLGEALWRQFLLASRAVGRGHARGAPVTLAALPTPTSAGSASSAVEAGSHPLSSPAPSGASLSDRLRLPERTGLAAAETRARSSVPAGIPGPPVPARGDGATITGVSQVAGPSGFRVHISTNRPASYKARRMLNPYRYVVELPNARIADDCARTIRVAGSVVERVDLAAKASGAVVTLTLKDRADCRAERSRDGHAIIALVEGPEPPGVTARAPRLAQAEAPPAAAAADLVDLQCVQADIAEVLALLAEYSGKNVVASKSAADMKVTVTLKQVTVARALDFVTKLEGLDWTLVDGQTYVVGTAEELAEIDPAYAPRLFRHSYKPQNTNATRLAARFDEVYGDMGITATPSSDLNLVVFSNITDQTQKQWLEGALPDLDVKAPDTYELVTLQYVTPAQVVPNLKELVPDVKVWSPEGIPANVIRLEGPPEVIDEAKKHLPLLDVDPATQVVYVPAPITSVKQVDYLALDDVVTLVSDQFGERVVIKPLEGAGGARPEMTGTGATDSGDLDRGGRVLITGAESDVEDVIAFIDLLDVPLPQVQVRGVVAEVRLTKDATRGFTWSLPGLSVSELNVVDNIKFGTFAREPVGPFTAGFEALVSNSKAKILAEPNVVAQHEKTGHILVGSIIPYEIAVAGEGTVTRSVQFQEIGLSLDFTPMVHSDDTVQLWLEPKVSTFTGFTPQGYPEVSTREASTILHVRDRQVIVVGGLFQDEEIETKSGIPFLKDWPLIGHFFSFRTHSRIRTEIVFMAEVTVMRPPA